MFQFSQPKISLPLLVIIVLLAADKYQKLCEQVLTLIARLQSAWTHE